MASLTVRDIPLDLYDRFKKLAKKEHRSLNAEVLAVIERVVREDEIREQQRAALESILESYKEKTPLPVDSITLLREDRAR